MKFSEAWLRRFITLDIDTTVLVDRLTMLGLEVDSVSPVAPPFTGVVVGHVMSVTKHPNAERLNCTLVDVGDGEPLTIVCGAKNVQPGLKVAVAVVGASLPGGFKIKKAKLRGEPSHGMICSAKELGIGENQSAGIMELDDQAPIGQDFREYYQLDDHVIDIELTPNRGDCASMLGIARDLSALYQTPIHSVDTTPIVQEHDDKVQCQIKDAAVSVCPRFATRIIKDIRTDIALPLPIQEALRRSGINSIHPVVDILNYVMLECGQPMHAYDLDSLNSRVIEVRLAKTGEQMTLLNEANITLTEAAVLVTDQHKPLSLAGVMGGQSSSVQANTTSILLESAYFDPIAIRRSAKSQALQTDASYRFERGIDPCLYQSALDRACHLIQQYLGGKAGPLSEYSASDHQALQTKIIDLQYRDIERILGIQIDKSIIECNLSSLGMQLEPHDNGDAWRVIIPSYRSDIFRSVDLVEEIARLYGYDNIAPSSLLLQASMPAIPETMLTVDSLANALVHLGFREVITYSFVSTAQQAPFLIDERPAVLVNPIASDLSEMRVSLWPGLLNTYIKNKNRQAGRVCIFESGLCFKHSEAGYDQYQRLGLLASGPLSEQYWGSNAESCGFFDLKGVVSHLLDLTGNKADYQWKPSSHPALHPGQSATLFHHDQKIGELGVLHPAMAESLGISETVCLFEAELPPLLMAKLSEFAPFSKYPSIKRDLALVVKESLTAQALLDLIREKAPDLLQNVEIFDIYQGEGIETGSKSIALELTFSDATRTLVDAEVQEVMDQLITQLENGLHAKIRA